METVTEIQHRCVFCRMSTTLRFLRLKVCEICRDQVYDFLGVSGVLALVTLAFDLGGMVFLVQEVLLFLVLIVVKHRFPPPWQRDHMG